MMRSSKNMMVGIVLVAFGLVVLFGLWDLVMPAILVAGSVYAYRQRRSQGKTTEAVQIGFWGMGLALLFAIGFSWPAILLLIGGSMLLRGREYAIAEYMPLLVGRVLRMRPHLPRRANKAQDVPISVEAAVEYQPYKPSVNDTTRL